MVISDFSKMDAPAQIHIAFQALHAFVKEHAGQLPRAHNGDDAVQLIQLARGINERAGDAEVERLDERLLTKFAHGAAGGLAPMAAVVGSVAAQEVIKVA